MKCKLCGSTIPDGSLYCNICGRYQLKKPKDEITVPKPSQLPSGKWRIQLRKEGISVTADTPEKCRDKALVERELWLRAEAEGAHEAKPVALTLGEVVDSYLAAKKPVLSPSTMSSYQSMRDNYFLLHWDDDVTKLDPQQLVNDEIKLGRKAKTIKNGWALCNSALKYAGVTAKPPTLPRIVKRERAYLNYDQILKFIKTVEGQPYEIAALLALHGLRRSEIFGLRPKDFDSDNRIIHIRGAMVYSIQDGWVRTELNKNDTSRRDVPILIDRLFDLLKQIDKKQEYIVTASRVELWRQINKACEFADLPKTGVHGLRHSLASLAYHLDLKKLSVQQIGGWSTSKVLDEIYTHNADLENDIETLREYFREKIDGRQT